MFFLHALTLISSTNNKLSIYTPDIIILYKSGQPTRRVITMFTSYVYFHHAKEKNNFFRSRINSYRALASPSLIALSSKVMKNKFLLIFSSF
jgi:hypothetical protein